MSNSTGVVVYSPSGLFDGDQTTWLRVTYWQGGQIIANPNDLTEVRFVSDSEVMDR